MPLSRLLPLLAALMAVTTAALVCWVGLSQWDIHQRAATAEAAVSELRQALQAAEMVSRERGPTNSVLGDESPALPERQLALQEARERTDRAFEALATLLQVPSDLPQRQRAALDFDACRKALAQARQAIDRTVAQSKALRTPEEIRRDVKAMVNIVPVIWPIVAMLAGDAERAYPTVSDSIHAARAAAELREAAGLLGSQFTASLAHQQPFSPQDRLAIEHTRGRIDELRTRLEVRMQSAYRDPTVLQAWQVARERYFGGANALLERIIQQGESDGRFGIDAGGFAALYVPQMNTMFGLRDVLLAQAVTQAQAAREHTWQVEAVLAAGIALLLITGLSCASLLRRRVLRPLGQATRALQALALDELDAPLPRPLADDEIAAVLGAVRALQIQTRQRMALEHERDQLIDQLREQSNTDFLTGLPNRRAFFAAAQRELAHAQRHGFPVTAVLLDVDHFKQLNDRHGHAAGDQTLCEVAEVVRRSLRLGDLVARFGGEEFVLLLSHTDLERGLRFAERLRESISGMTIAAPGGAVLNVTVSLGVADSKQPAQDLEALLASADTAMYRAKEAGRNRVVAARQSEQMETLHDSDDAATV